VEGRRHSPSAGIHLHNRDHSCAQPGAGDAAKDVAAVASERAAMLSPRDSHLWSFHHVRSWVRFALAEYDVAAEFARRASRQPNATYRAFATLAASLGKFGDKAQARLATWR
jgi:hypothetical protein